MPTNFYSGTEAELASGSANMLAIITPFPENFGLTSARVASYSALTANYADLLTQSTAPGTRTPVAISGKNLAKRLLKTASIQLGSIIASTPTVDDAQLMKLGLNARLNRQTRRVPEATPMVVVTSVVGRLVKIHVRDGASERRGLPFGATGINLYSFVGDSAPEDSRAYHFEGMSTRAKTQIQFPNSVASGATVWLSVCWVSGRGETSAASVPKSFTLQGGAVVPEAA